MAYTVPMEKWRGMSLTQNPSGANRDSRGMVRLVPWSFALLVWYQGIHLSLDFYPEILAPLIPEVLWDQLAAGSVTLVFLALLLPIYVKLDGLSVADLGFTAKPKIADFFRAAAAGACIWLFADAMLRYAGILTGGAEINASAVEEVKTAATLLASTGLAGILCLFVPILIQAPITEEIIYRGVVIASLRASWGEGPWKNFFAAAVSGFIFAIAHGLGHRFYYGVYFLIGLAFACLYQRTRSLTAVIIAHGAFNAFPLIKPGVMGLLTICGLRGS